MIEAAAGVGNVVIVNEGISTKVVVVIVLKAIGKGRDTVTIKDIIKILLLTIDENANLPGVMARKGDIIETVIGPTDHDD